MDALLGVNNRQGRNGCIIGGRRRNDDDMQVHTDRCRLDRVQSLAASHCNSETGSTGLQLQCHPVDLSLAALSAKAINIKRRICSGKTLHKPCAEAVIKEAVNQCINPIAVPPAVFIEIVKFSRPLNIVPGCRKRPGRARHGRKVNRDFFLFSFHETGLLHWLVFNLPDRFPHRWDPALQ